MRRMCLQSMCPEKLASHLDMHVARLDPYLKMRAEIAPYLEASQSRDKSGASPMDVDFNTMYPKGAKGAKGANGAKGKGKRQVQGQGVNIL